LSRGDLVGPAESDTRLADSEGVLTGRLSEGGMDYEAIPNRRGYERMEMLVREHIYKERDFTICIKEKA
jgi:hypothetical protein